MKRIIALTAAVLSVLTLFASCSIKKKQIELASETVTTVTQTQTTSEPTTAAPVTVSVKAQDCFEGSGYTHFVCPESGRYVFDTQNSDGVEWTVYIIDSEFPGEEKYIKENYSPELKGAGSLNIEAGQYIYIHCSVNSLTANEPNTEAVYSFTEDLI